MLATIRGKMEEKVTLKLQKRMDKQYLRVDKSSRKNDISKKDDIGNKDADGPATEYGQQENKSRIYFQ